jgi:hypothetical protein
VLEFQNCPTEKPLDASSVTFGARADTGITDARAVLTDAVARAVTCASVALRPVPVFGPALPCVTLIMSAPLKLVADARADRPTTLPSDLSCLRPHDVSGLIGSHDTIGKALPAIASISFRASGARQITLYLGNAL